MDNREAWISTTGAAVNILTDGRIDDILDEAYVGLSEGEYAEAAFAFLENADIFMRQGVPDGQYQYDSETGQMVKYRSLTLVEILVAVVISLGAGFLCCVAVWRRYRMKSAEEAYPFRQNAKLLLTRNEDRFINKSLSSVVVQNTSSSSGGRSSGGRSYTRSTTCLLYTSTWGLYRLPERWHREALAGEERGKGLHCSLGRRLKKRNADGLGVKKKGCGEKSG